MKQTGAAGFSEAAKLLHENAMKCPYCMEEINDAAIACRFCGRDLSLLSPMMQRITGLEAKLSALSESLSLLQSGVTPTQDSLAQQSAPNQRRTRQFFGATLLASVLVVLLGLQYVPLTHLGLPGWAAGLILAAMVAAIAAVVGYRYPLRLDTYLAGALLQSGLSMLLWTMWQLLLRSSSQRIAYLRDDLPYFMLKNFVPIVLWFFSGAWVGGLIRCFRDRSYSRERLSARLARRLIGQGGQKHDASFDRRVARLAAVIAAVAPVLTFIASLITRFSRK